MREEEGTTYKVLKGSVNDVLGSGMALHGPC